MAAAAVNKLEDRKEMVREVFYSTCWLLFYAWSTVAGNSLWGMCILNLGFA